MQQSQAIEMLSVPDLRDDRAHVWVDLGSGSGTFTLALAEYLTPESQIFAVDKDASSLNNIPDQFNHVNIEKRQTDFLDIEFPSESLDGILIANSLHYVQCQEVFIDRVKQYLKPDGCFLIVEYDTDKSNSWIPYPLGFDRLKQLFKHEGFSSIRKIHEKPSRYNRSNLYSAIIRK